MICSNCMRSLIASKDLTLNCKTLSYWTKAKTKGGEEPGISRFPKSNLSNPVHPYIILHTFLVRNWIRLLCMHNQVLSQQKSISGFCQYPHINYFGLNLHCLNLQNISLCFTLELMSTACLSQSKYFPTKVHEPCL